MKIWKRWGFIATVVVVMSFPIYLVKQYLLSDDHSTQKEAQFVGRDACVECHKKEYDLWQGSHHDMAMDTAIDKTVLGNFSDHSFSSGGKTHRMFKRNGKFFVNTEGPNGTFEDFQVAYVFGYTPLQQYLVPFTGGRLQCLPLAWDSQKNKWFHLGETIYAGQDIKPDNWLHWTQQAQNWNGMCADCHSTNLEKNYDPKTNTFNTTWSEIDVSCEACHGPASHHLEWAKLPEGSRPINGNSGLLVKTKNLDNKELLNVCARCHTRRGMLDDFKYNNGDLLDVMTPQLITQPIYHADGQILDENYEYGSFTQSKMFEKGVKCSDCHDSHSGKTKMNDNQLCLQCHRPDLYDTPKHHFHQMADANKPLTNRNEPEYVKGSGAQCVNCHMVGKYYMGNDYRRDHSFRIPRPDLTASIDVPNACNDCHKDKTTQWSQSYVEKWYGMKKPAHYGQTFAAAEKNDASAIPNLILYSQNELFPIMVRATAIELLGRFNTSESIKAMEYALTDPASLVRLAAANGYQVSDMQVFYKNMSPLLNDPVLSIRNAASLKLAQLPDSYFSTASLKARQSAVDGYMASNFYMADFPSGWYNIGLMYNFQGKFDEAIDAYKNALKTDNLFTRAKVNLAHIYTQQGKLEETEKLLRQVMVESPELDDINYSMALLMAEKGDVAESRKFFLKAISLMPENSRIIYNYALFENGQGNTTVAESYLLKAYDAEPTNFDYLYALSTFFLEHNKIQRANEFASKLITIYPENANAKQVYQATNRR